MKSILTTIVLTLVLTLNAQAAGELKEIAKPQTLTTIDAVCTKYVTAIDTMACPVIRVFQYTGEAKDLRNPRLVGRLLKAGTMASYELGRVNVVEASLVITSRLPQQLDWLLENSEISEADFSEVESMISDLQEYVLGWKQIVYGDSDAYWAPSVNAAVVVLVNPQTKVVIEILHGDTDG